MTARSLHTLFEQLAQLQHDVAVLRDWTALLDEALQDFASSLSESCAAHAPCADEHDTAAWPADRSALALRTRRVRQAAGLTCAQLARLAHVAASTVRNIEHGRHHTSKRTRQRLLPQLQQLERTLHMLRIAPLQRRRRS